MESSGNTNKILQIYITMQHKNNDLYSDIVAPFTSLRFLKFSLHKTHIHIIARLAMLLHFVAEILAIKSYIGHKTALMGHTLFLYFIDINVIAS